MGLAPNGRRRVFTDYLRALAAQDTAELNRLLPELMKALRATAVSELRRRGLWNTPPAYLGFADWRGWEAADGEALDELVSACYEASFVARLRSLIAQLKVKDNVDGLVILNVRHLLHTLQLRHDPVGARVFEALRQAVRLLIAGGKAQILSGSLEILNDTVLGLERGAMSASTESRVPEASVAGWSDALLPGLLTSRDEERGHIVAELADRISTLPRLGYGVVQVRNLIDPLRTATRARWAAVLAQTEERVGIDRESAGPSDRDVRFGSLARTYRPDAAIEAWDSFVKLTDCVTQRLEGLRTPRGTSRHFVRLWQYLRLYAQDPGARLPSRRRLSELLGIPRNSLPGIYRVLSRLVDDCREELASGPLVVALGPRLPVTEDGAR